LTRLVSAPAATSLLSVHLASLRCSYFWTVNSQRRRSATSGGLTTGLLQNDAKLNSWTALLAVFSSLYTHVGCVTAVKDVTAWTDDGQTGKQTDKHFDQRPRCGNHGGATGDRVAPAPVFLPLPLFLLPPPGKILIVIKCPLVTPRCDLLNVIFARQHQYL